MEVHTYSVSNSVITSCFILLALVLFVHFLTSILHFLPTRFLPLLSSSHHTLPLLLPIFPFPHQTNTPRLPGIPTFPSHSLHRQHILIHTAAVFRDFARRGFTEGMSGHISVRDPEFPSYIWMNPLGRHFGLMTAGDLICLDVETGKIVGGNRVCGFFSFF
jgi:hypothetical protein